MPTVDTMPMPTTSRPTPAASPLPTTESPATILARQPRTDFISRQPADIGAPIRTSLVFREMARSLMPAYPRLYTSGDLVLDDVTGFITARIAGLSPLYRWPCRLAIAGFQWSAILRHGCKFTRLPPLKQRDHLDAWSSSRFGARRDFIRLIRNLTLLAFYEHPIVLNWLGIHRDQRRYERMELRRERIAVQFDERLESLRA